MNRRGAAELRQQRSVQIDPAQRRETERRLRQNLAVVAHDKQIRIPLPQLRCGLFRINAVRRIDGEASLFGQIAHRIQTGLLAPFGRRRGSRDQSQHVVRRVEQRAKSRHRKRARAHHEQTHLEGSIS
jgi:hypothetical protein